MSEPVVCERCGQPHERCKGHNRSGLPCGRWPTKGHRVCRKHGAAAPQAIAAAEVRQEEAAAQEAFDRSLWRGLSNATPVTDPLEALSLLAGALGEMVDELGERVKELKTVEAGKDLSTLRGTVVLFDKTVGHYRALLADITRLGIAERGVRLQERQAELVAGAVQASVVVAALSPEQRGLFVGEFMRRLRSGVPDGGMPVLEEGGSS